MPRSVGNVGRSYVVRGLPVKRWEMGPWTGVVRAEGSRPDLRTLYFAYNGMIFPSGSGMMTRPGLDTIAGGALLGTGSTRMGQLVFQYNRSDGSYKTIAICGGKFYTYNWTTDAWTEAITAGTFSGAGVTLSTSNRCYACVCGNKLIVSDGTNTPWMWDGTTVTLLSNAPVAFGAPVVYGSKVFFIKNTERDTIVWSEENDPTIGYEAGGYNNSWTLAQTGSENLIALASTNEALYFFRRDSVGAIYGAVNPDFQTSATRDSVSTVIGCGALGGVLVYDKWVWFVDMRGRLHRFAPGGSIEPIWQQHAADSGVWEDRSGLSLGGSPGIAEIGALLVATDLVAVTQYGMVLAYSTSNTNMRAYDATTGAYQGNWTPAGLAEYNLYGAVYDDKNNAYTTMALGLAPDAPTLGGGTAIFHEIQNTSSATAGKDYAVLYTFQMVTQPIGLNEELNWRFTRAVIRYESALAVDMTGYVQAIVPTDSETGTTAPTALQVTYKARRAASIPRTGTINIGLNHVGRSLQLALTSNLTQQGWYRIVGLTVEAVPLDQTVEPY